MRNTHSHQTVSDSDCESTGGSMCPARELADSNKWPESVYWTLDGLSSPRMSVDIE